MPEDRAGPGGSLNSHHGLIIKVGQVTRNSEAAYRGMLQCSKGLVIRISLGPGQRVATIEGCFRIARPSSRIFDSVAEHSEKAVRRGMFTDEWGKQSDRLQSCDEELCL